MNSSVLKSLLKSYGLTAEELFNFLAETTVRRRHRYFLVRFVWKKYDKVILAGKTRNFKTGVSNMSVVFFGEYLNPEKFAKTLFKSGNFDEIEILDVKEFLCKADFEDWNGEGHDVIEMFTEKKNSD
jgi:hypothetical protein